MTSSASIATDNISALLDIIRPGIAGELVSNPGFSLMDKSSTELWIGNLSASNFANTAKELYRILTVATKLDIEPVTKMEILDSLSHYLQQPPFF